ncbi:MAG: RNA polymerase sigma-70 factor [Ferrovibrio sp.]|nr:RNA polymerase sigma-70 factor [Ferrovibrio sp.]
MNAHADIFERHRRRLQALAYRMLGSLGEAEDAVQDTYLRWHGQQIAALRSSEAWLVTACTRLCIDRLRAAKVEREAYTGPWLPEPVVSPDAGFEVELAESLSMAFLLVLERLSPPERAAYLLRQAFDYEYPQIAEILGKSEAACRQLVSRAEKHLREERPRFGADAAAARDLAKRFAAATESGDPAAFAGLLAEDALIWSDGGGKAQAALNVIHGADRCARFFAGIARKRRAGHERRLCRVNGQPGFVVFENGMPVSVFTFEIVENRIRSIFVVRNPDKLARLDLLH